MSSINFDRVLTTGSSGMIGSYIDFGMRPDQEVLDITNETQVREYVLEHKPELIIHLAAAADMGRSEEDSAYVYDLNVRGTYNIARAASEVDAAMVYASSSRVFKGDKTTPYTEADVPQPETQYGRTKHIGELLVQQLVPQHLITRTAWVFGGGPERDNKFYGNVLRQLQSGVPEIVALDDVFGSPTYAKDYIKAVKELLIEGAIGTYHITNSGTATRYDLATELVRIFKPGTPVRAVDRSYFRGASALPDNEGVLSERFKLRSWKEALAEYINEEWLV